MSKIKEDFQNQKSFGEKLKNALDQDPDIIPVNIQPLPMKDTREYVSDCDRAARLAYDQFPDLSSQEIFARHASDDDEGWNDILEGTLELRKEYPTRKEYEEHMVRQGEESRRLILEIFPDLFSE